MSTNLVILTGRTVRTPEIKPNESGTKTVLMTLAVNDGKTKSGEPKVDYIQVKAFVAKDAKSNGPYDYIGKGQLISVQGKLRYSSYEKDGKTVYTQDVIVDNGGVSLLEGSRKEEE